MGYQGVSVGEHNQITNSGRPCQWGHCDLRAREKRWQHAFPAQWPAELPVLLQNLLQKGYPAVCLGSGTSGHCAAPETSGKDSKTAPETDAIWRSGAACRTATAAGDARRK